MRWVILTAAVMAAPASAYNYSLSAGAGADGAATSDVDVGFVEALDRNPDEASIVFETYSASASGQGQVSASAQSAGVPPFAPISHRAVARIEETVRFLPPPFPSGDVTVTAGISATPMAASADGSTASASAMVQIEPFSESCSASISHTGELGGSCAAGTVGAGTVTRTFTLAELSQRQWEIDVAAQVDATLGLFAANGASSASAVGGLWVQVSGGGVTEYFWSGTGTNIPVPEPGAAVLGAAALGACAALRRRRG